MRFFQDRCGRNPSASEYRRVYVQEGFSPPHLTPDRGTLDNMCLMFSLYELFQLGLLCFTSKACHCLPAVCLFR